MILLLMISLSLFAEPPTPFFIKKPKGTAYEYAGFWSYLPSNYGDRPSPLLIYFHGSDENGNGNVYQLQKLLLNGPVMLIDKKKWPAHLPFVVLAPQQQRGCPSADQIDQFIQFAVRHYNIDLSRIYLTGLSCGAIGIDRYLAKYGGEQVAAAVLIAGTTENIWYEQKCNVSEDTALWIFHGDKDDTIAPARSHPGTELMMNCKDRKEVRLTIYRGVGHNSWTQTYNPSSGVYEWLLKFSR